MNPDSLAARLYRAFDVGPLTDTQQDLRVELDATRKSRGVAARLNRKIRLCTGGKSSHVIAGHRGSGKSTELYHLRHLLESSEASQPRFCAIVCDTNTDIDRNDVDFLDVLVSIIRHLATELETKHAISLKPGYFRDRLTGLIRLLKSDVSAEGLTLSEGFAQVSLTIKSSPDARAELRKAFEPDAGNWLNAANQVIGDAIHELSKKGFSGLVILVDDLDKIARVRHRETDCGLAENLFVRRAAQLTGLDCHVVYSMPLELAYSHNEPAVKSSFGGEVPVLPMTKVRSRPPESTPCDDGIEAFLDLVDRRVASVDATRKDLFDSEETARQIILLSGGQPTELMTLITEGLLWGAPITASSIDELKVKGRREYAMQIRKEHWDTIERVRKDGMIIRSNNTERAVVELLESRMVLQYLNGDPWYRENPYIADLRRPEP